MGQISIGLSLEKNAISGVWWSGHQRDGMSRFNNPGMFRFEYVYLLFDRVVLAALGYLMFR